VGLYVFLSLPFLLSVLLFCISATRLCHIQMLSGFYGIIYETQFNIIQGLFLNSLEENQKSSG
jgi:hypothetical protein